MYFTMGITNKKFRISYRGNIKHLNLYKINGNSMEQDIHKLLLREILFRIMFMCQS